MEYNNYYSPQPNHRPTPPNQQLAGGNMGGPVVGPQIPPQSQNHPMMHSSMPQQNTRQTMPPGPPNNNQQQLHLQHQSYQQIHPSHGSPAHSNATHVQQHQQQPQQQHHNHQSNMTGPLPQQAIGPHLHSQSPHHHGPMPPHMQSQQPLNHMVRPQLGPVVINHQQPSMNHSMVHHQQTFFGNGSMNLPGLHYHHQQNHHHHHHLNQQAAHHHIHHHQPLLMHHGPPPQMSGHYPPHIQQGLGQNSPYFLNILQTEFRIIEFNRRLQSRPLRYSNNPMPSQLDEQSIWWDRFASEFFEDDASLTLRLILEEKPVEYTIGRTLIPRFFRTYFDGGVTDLSISLRNPKESFIQPSMLTLDCDQAFIVTNNIFKISGMPSNHGVVVHTEGHLIVDFVGNNFDPLSIKSWRFYTRRCYEYIDRALLTTLGLPNNYFAEPITKQGLTKSTVSYLKMCMIMEPMQELMFQHKQTKMDPRSCLRKLLFDRYKHRSGDDNRAATNKRRKRKPAATSAMAGTATTKKSKAGLNNALNNNSGISNNNTMMISPTAMTGNFSLATQDVMIVGEPSMMGGDFGDDNERMITRLENTQYDPTASSLDDEIRGLPSGESKMVDSIMQVDTNGSIDKTIAQAESSSPQQVEPINNSLSQQSASILNQIPLDSHHSSSSQPVHQEQEQLQQQQQPQQQDESQSLASHTDFQQPIQSIACADSSDPDRTDATQLTPKLELHEQAPVLLSESKLEQAENGPVNSRPIQSSDTFPIIQDNQGKAQIEDHNQHNMGQFQEVRLQSHINLPSIDDEVKQISLIAPALTQDISVAMKIETQCQENNVQHHITTDVKISPMLDKVNGSDVMPKSNSNETPDMHADSIQTLNDESNSNSQLACTTADNAPKMEQQQPVDNGVA